MSVPRDTTPTTGPVADDDLHWFEVLGGASVGNAGAPDAAALRRALMVDDASEPRALTGWDAQASRARLLARLAHEHAADDPVHWFEGIGTAAPELHTDVDAQRLRAVLADADLPLDLAPNSATRVRLLNRMATFAPTPSQPVPRGWLQRWWDWLGSPGPGVRLPGMALAVMLLMTGVGVLWQQQIGVDDGETVRAGPDGGSWREVSEPEPAARRLAAELSAAGISAQVVQSGDVWEVKAGLPKPMEAPVEKVLRDYRITAPTDGRLVITFALRR